MAEEFALAAAPRAAGHPRRDRAEGYVPAVVYGHGLTPKALRVEAKALGLLLTRGGAHHLVRLSVDGEPEARTVVVKEVQRHPVSRAVRHVDFQAVSARERIHTDVPLRLVGEDQVQRAGGVLQVMLHSLRVACLPADLPERIEAPVGGLGLGQSLTVAAVAAVPGVTILNDADEVVAHVLAPRTGGAEAAPAEGGAKAEE